jgi:hypothetical protein
LILLFFAILFFDNSKRFLSSWFVVTLVAIIMILVALNILGEVAVFITACAEACFCKKKKVEEKNKVFALETVFVEDKNLM